MKLFDNMQLDIYFKGGVSIRTKSQWLINFDGGGMFCAHHVSGKMFDLDDRNRLIIVGVDEV
jgi:hypothetical protein